MKLKITITFILTLFSLQGMSATIDYEQGMQVKLGGAFDPFKPFDTAALGSCYDVVIDEQEDIIATEQFSSKFINSYEEFIKETGQKFQLSAKGNFGLSQIGASVSQSKEKAVFEDNNSIIYIVSGTKIYNPKTAVNISLNTEGNSILKADKSLEQVTKGFYKRCGRGLVTSITKETKISVVYIFEASSSSKRESIQSAITASASGTAGSIKASYNINQAARKADESVKVTIRVYQSGTLDNDASVKDIIGEDPGDISIVRTNLKAAISDISWKSSQIKSFNTDPVAYHFDVGDEEDFDFIDYAYIALNEARKSSSSLVERYNTLNSLLNKKSNAIQIKAKDELLSELKSIKKSLRHLSKQMKVCFRSGGMGDECDIDRYEINNSVDQYVSFSHGGFQLWSATINSSGYNHGNERLIADLTYYPIIEIYNLEYLKKLEYVVQGVVVASLTHDELTSMVNNDKLTLPRVSQLNTSHVWYCWSAPKHIEEVCNPALKPANLKNLFKSRFSAIKSEIVFHSIFNDKQIIELPSLANQGF